MNGDEVRDLIRDLLIFFCWVNSFIIMFHVT
jgi:hypothetical protein